MSKSIPNILFTTELNGKEIAQSNFRITIIPFISFEYLKPEIWLDEVPKDADTWVFTSKKAVKSVMAAKTSLQQPDHIFAVGSKTAEKLKGFTTEIITPPKFTLESLAQKMKEFPLKNVVHFCGNLKAGDLGELLENEVKLTSVEVYQTRLNPQKINTTQYDGVVFMSPSAVESFFRENQLNPEVPVFCIGSTTQAATQKIGIERGITPEEYTVESLTATIKNYYA